MSKLAELLNQISTPAKVAKVANLDPEISKISRGSYPKTAISEDYLRALAGDDWPEIRANSDQLEALAVAAQTAEQIQRGEVPAHYTARTTCRHCGEVAIFPGCPSNVLGCPWCFRKRGKPREGG